MLRIRRVPDDTVPSNAVAIAQVQDILRRQFPLADEDDILGLPGKLRDPLRYRFRSLLDVAEDEQGRVKGFALLLHAPDLNFTYLDFVATDVGRGSAGIGGALYERVREESLALGAAGLFFECLPDDPALCTDPQMCKQNADRLSFYERYGARPIANTRYETPLSEGGENPPYLVLDALGQEPLPGRDRMRVIVRAILDRKYGDMCPPGYIDMVVDSFADDPVVLRPLRYVRREPKSAVEPRHVLAQKIALVVNEAHQVHHVRERGYVEAPVRIRVILGELERTELFERIAPRSFAESRIREVHDGDYVEFLKRACALVETGRSIYPYVFPVRNKARPPKELPIRAGYYCIDTFTPLNQNAYLAARGAVDCALTAAEQVLQGHRLAYALVRPPGHHAERRAFGGFSYFNNAAIAANFLARYGRVAVLDIDYHHGNGTQDIFYRRSDVLTVSIHGHPRFAYPYFSGFRDETGLGAGAGFNVNIPLPETITAEDYLKALGEALRRIARFDPAYLVLAVGFDTAKGDPTGSWPHRAADFERLGQTIGGRGWPTAVIQEGGYRTRTLGVNARRFFEGLAKPAKAGRRPARAAESEPSAPPMETVWRREVGQADIEPIRALAEAAGVFSAAEAGIARELVERRVAEGVASGYEFIVAERGGQLQGFVCYGEIPGTEKRFDLYWIVIHPNHQRGGLGADLLRRAVAAVTEAGGHWLFIETSTREAYAPARAFYRRQGFRKVAELPNYYRDGDGKAVFARRLDGAGAILDPSSLAG